MEVGRLDLDPEFEYLITYVSDGELNTWTLPEDSFQRNYKSMRKSKDTQILGVYKKLSDSEILDVMTR